MSNPESGRRNVIVGVAIAAVIVLVVGIAWAVQSNRDTSGDKGAVPGDNTSATGTPETGTPETGTPETGTPETEEPGSEPRPSLPIALVDEFGIGMGDPEAPVKVEIFEDFSCPHCRDFEAASSDALADAAAQGAAFVVYRPMAFLGEYSDKALNAIGVVLDSGNGEAALALHDRLFENPPSAAATDAWFVDQAVEAGADRAAVESGILEGTFKQWAVNATDAGSKRGVTGTPTVFVNGEQVGGASIEEYVSNVMAAIAAG